MNAKQFQLAADIAATRSLTVTEAYERLIQTMRVAGESSARLDEHKTDLPVKLGGPIWDEVWGLLDEFLDEYEALPPRNRDPEV